MQEHSITRLARSMADERTAEVYRDWGYGTTPTPRHSPIWTRIRPLYAEVCLPIPESSYVQFDGCVRLGEADPTADRNRRSSHLDFVANNVLPADEGHVPEDAPSLDGTGHSRWSQNDSTTSQTNCQ